jgi:hypothetical protein
VNKGLKLKDLISIRKTGLKYKSSETSDANNFISCSRANSEWPKTDVSRTWSILVVSVRCLSLTRLIAQRKFGAVVVYGSWLNFETKTAAIINFEPELIWREKLRVEI